MILLGTIITEMTSNNEGVYIYIIWHVWITRGSEVIVLIIQPSSNQAHTNSVQELWVTYMIVYRHSQHNNSIIEQIMRPTAGEEG